MAQLSHDYPTSVAAISVNVDFDEPAGEPSDELQSQVIQRLQEKQVDVENVICTNPLDDALKHWDVFGLPALVVYGPDGQVHTKFEGAVHYDEEVIPLVKSLVGEADS